MYQILRLCFIIASFILITLPSKSFEFADWKSDENPQKWMDQAKKTINSILNSKINQNVAKNLIIFLGDGICFNFLKI